MDNSSRKAQSLAHIAKHATMRICVSVAVPTLSQATRRDKFATLAKKGNANALDVALAGTRM